MQFQIIFSFSQGIMGFVETKTGKKLIGATVTLNNLSKQTITDKFGFFEFLSLKEATYKINVSFVGYENTEKTITFNATDDYSIRIIMKESDNLTEEVIISAIRVGEKSPVASSTINKKDLEKNNIGQEIPYLLSLMPSVVVSSDAGAGIGYSKFSIRGTDMTRINVTTNGIPLNDAESHGVWWVNMPDFGGSVESIQVQRGVGSSTNGPAAFGANVNFQTNTVNKDVYAQLNSSYGSFNTYKGSVKLGTGIINEHFSMDMRISQIHTDGFIDRASADLNSISVSGAYINDKTLIKLIVISGNEKTYQAWNGVPKVRLENDIEGMQRYQNHWLYSEQETMQMINSDSRTYNKYTYKNEVDNYSQDHYQFIVAHELFDNLNFNLALNYTKGKGYYEQYKNNENLEDYSINPIIIGTETVNNSDLIRRKQLDNDFYALSYSLIYKKNKFKTILGGSYSTYKGDHFGNIIWTRFAGNSEINYQWYFNLGEKNDFNVFTKFEYAILNKFNLFADIQYRKINYKITGIDDDLTDISQKHNYNFINPKFGVNYDITDKQNLYIYVGMANREPSRTDFKDALGKIVPTPETLIDYELGYTIATELSKINVNFYYMDYENQLVKTGKINNVGKAIMTNIPESYRAGVEISGGIKFLEIINWQLNTTLSRNKISKFTSYVDNWDEGGQNQTYIGETNISFSPEIIAGSNLSFELFKNFNISLISKYVSKQYIDNTSDKIRMLDAYLLNNIKIDYSIKTKFLKSIDFHVLVNNILSEKYETNAWVYRYYLGGEYYNMDGYFPQAGINFLAGVSLNF